MERATLQLYQKLDILKEFLREIDSNYNKELFFETKIVENNINIAEWLEFNKNKIKENFKYNNYCNLDKTKDRHITQYLKMICKDLNIPVERKIKTIKKNDKVTSKSIFCIRV